MLEIDVSRLLDAAAAPFNFSRSRAEAGPLAGPTSWQNAKAEVKERPLLLKKECQSVRDYFGGFGAWDDAERAAWTRDDCAALVLQYASGDLREAQACCPGDGIGNIDWEDYQAQASEGRLSGNLFVSGRKLFISLSN